MAAKVRLPEELFSSERRPPVELSTLIELRLTVGEEGAVIAPYCMQLYRDVYGRYDGSRFEVSMLLFRREGDSFVQVEPLYRLPLLEVEDIEVGVDVYRASDVPDDAVAVLARITVSKSSETVHAIMEAMGKLDEKEKTELKRLLEQYVNYVYSLEGRHLNFRFNHEDCRRPIPALGERSDEYWDEEEEGAGCAPCALRLPAGEYLLLPEERWSFTTALVHGRGDFWHSPQPLKELDLDNKASIGVYEPPSPEDGYVLLLVTKQPTKGPRGCRAYEARMVHVLDYRLPPGEEASAKELARLVYDALFYLRRDWDFDREEVEEAVKEAFSR